jgi:hypothetical protein
VFSVRLTETQARGVDVFANDMGLNRTAAMRLLIAYGLRESRSTVMRGVVAALGDDGGNR